MLCLPAALESGDRDVGKQGLRSQAALVTEAVAQRLRKAESSVSRSAGHPAVPRAQRQCRGDLVIWGVVSG